MGAFFLKAAIAGNVPRDGFEFNFPGAAYQMVPVGDDRPMQILTDDKDWFLRRARGNTAGSLRLKDFQGGLVRSDPLGDLIIPKASTIKFNLHGDAPGDNLLQLADRNGTVSHSLRVSVKAKLPKTYAIRMVKDAKRRSTRPIDDATAIMREVENLYLDQANIQLKIADDPVEFLVPQDLGKTIFLDKHLAAIVASTPNNNIADFFVYCVWNVEDSTKPNSSAVGLTGQNRSFIDDGLTFGQELITKTFGHELGHAMGLPDVSSSTERLMFRARAGGLKLVEEEIDKINRSGVSSP